MQRLALFLRLWVWFGFRHLGRQRLRTLTVLLGIGLGAAVFTSVRLSVDASLDSFTRSVDAVTGKTDLIVAKPGGRVDEHLVSVLLRHPAVRTASPFVSAYVRSEGSEPFLLIGLDPILDRPLREWQAESSDDARTSWIDLLSEPYTLVASERLVERLHASPGGFVKLEHIDRKGRFRIVETLASKGLAMADGGETAITDIATFQELTGSFGLVDRIDILLAPGAEGADSIRRLLPDGLVLEQPGESRESGRLMIRSYRINLSVLSFVSLFVGMFLVFSLVSLHANARRHEISTLRSLGASSRTIFQLFLAEGIFFGLAGWIAAIPLSFFLLRRLLGMVSSTIALLFVRVQVEHLSLDPWDVALSFLTTLGVSMLAAAQPAWQSMRVAPREAMIRQDSVSHGREGLMRHTLTGLLIAASALPVSLLPAPAGLPLPGYAATFLLFLGFSLLSPLWLRLMGAWLPPLLGRVGGQPAYLGGRYMRDSGARAAVSVGALITAVALFAALSIMIHSFRSTVDLWVNRSISGDVFIRPKMAEINHYKDAVPREVVSALQHLDTPVDLLPYRRIPLRYGKINYQFEVIDFETFVRYSRFILMSGKEEEMLPGLVSGQAVLVSEVFSNQAGLSVGDRYVAEIEGVRIDVPVVGVFRDYRTQGGVVHYSLPRFIEKTGDASWSGARVHFREQGGDVRARAERLRKDILVASGPAASGIDVTLGEDLRQAVLDIFDETFSITTVLLVIALVVAALGITTTLTVLVLERTRQIHTLIACGASRGQVRAMIVWEAVLMVAAGEVMGLACGFLLSYLLIFVINRQSFGWTFIYSVDWAYLAASLPLIAATALPAALSAARLVLGQSPATILRER
ncbi:MAG: FtsX-like permease family protein [Acidobacteriota bacterium]